MGKVNMKLMQGIEETEKQIQTEKQTQESDKVSQSILKGTETGKVPKKPQKSQEALKQSQPRKNTKKSKKAENEPNTRSQKQVFSFRAMVSDISVWKAYTTASGKTMENIGTVAMNEYIKRHKLTEAEQAVFDALRVREENRK